MTTTTFTDGWTYRTPLGPFAAAGTDAVEATPVRLPHDALRDADRFADAPSKGGAAYHPAGAYSYVKEFDVPAEWAGKVVRLEVQGAYRRAMVFLNDEFAGNRADGFARFFVDLTPYLRHGARNTLRIEVRSGEDSRWYAGAGLHRPVLLHVDEATHIVPDGVRVTTVRVEDDQAVLEVATTVTNRGLTTAQVRVQTVLSAPDGATVEGDDTPLTLAPGRTSVVRQRLYLETPALWSVDSPTLYSAHTRLDDGTPGVLTAVGIRTVTVDPRKGLRVNGEPVLLRGACVHSDNGPLGAASIERAEERRIQLLKEAGFNAIRAAHNPASPSMLDACDRIGMLVIDEAFDMWTRGKTNYDYAAEFPQWWAADLESMVAKDINHPSVIMYSIGNEIIEVGTPHGAAWARELAEHVRTLDPSRLVTNGVNAFLAVIDELASILAADQGLNELMGDMGGGMSAIGTSNAVTRRTEESSAVLDVLGLNYADGRYRSDADLFPHRVLVGSETFPTQIGSLWPLVLENPNVLGDFTWTGWDYLGETGIGTWSYGAETTGIGKKYPELIAGCGLIDITGHPGAALLLSQAAWGLLPAPQIAVHPLDHAGESVHRTAWRSTDAVQSWAWAGADGRRAEVDVYSSDDQVELVLNGRSLGRKAAGERRGFMTRFRVPYETGEITAIGYRDGVETGRSSLRSAGAPSLRLVTDRDAITADGQDLAFLRVELADADGVVETLASDLVSVEVIGAGRLAALGSAAPSSTESFTDAEHSTWRGRALAVVRAGDEAGEVEVRVTSRHHGSATLTLAVTASRARV